MPFQSEKQRRYMHANLPELAQRWERDYADGGIARIPFALPPNTTAGNYENEINEMMNTRTAFKPNSPLDKTLKEKSRLDELMPGSQSPSLENLLQQDWDQRNKQPLSLEKDKYSGVEGYTAELPIGASNYMTDATWSGLGKKFSDLNFMNQAGATTNEGITTPGLTEGLSTDVFESPTAVSGTDFGNTNFFGEPVVDEVVSKSFKDHDNFKSWIDANPQMGENITRKAKEYYEKSKSGINWAAKAAMTGLGKAVNLPLGLMSGIASFKNPLNPNSSNFSPTLGSQIDYLNKFGALGGSSGPYKIRGGVLAGQNLVSMFGTNNYDKMLQKRIDYFHKQKQKKGALTKLQNEKLQATLKEKAAADAAARARTVQTYGDASKNINIGSGGGHGYDPQHDYSGTTTQAAHERSSDLGFSDIRLKDNIELMGQSPSNINIYKFNYLNDPTVYQGVMAQEVPWANVKADNGYLMVDYNKVDVEFKKWHKK